MGKVTNLAAPKSDGVEVTDDFFIEEETLTFTYTRRDGKAVDLEMIVDASRVSNESFRRYLREVAAIGREAEARSHADSPAVATDETKSDNAEAENTETDARDEGLTPEAMETVAEYVDLMARVARIDAELLAPAIVDETQADTPRRGWNVPNVSPTTDVLAASSGVGAAAREALKDWYFPTSNEPEAAIGETATASTPDTSGS